MENLELNKVYQWSEIEQIYPDLYVIITDVKEQAGEIVSCRLLDVCSKQDKPKYIKKYMESNIKFDCCRTTFNAPNVGTLL